MGDDGGELWPLAEVEEVGAGPPAEVVVGEARARPKEFGEDRRPEDHEAHEDREAGDDGGELRPSRRSNASVQEPAEVVVGEGRARPKHFGEDLRPEDREVGDERRRGGGERARSRDRAAEARTRARRQGSRRMISLSAGVSPTLGRMADLADGATTEVQGSGKQPYVLKNTGGVYSCTCPAWRNQGGAPERRTCKHLKALRGEAAELTRIGASAGSAPAAAPKRSSRATSSTGTGAAEEEAAGAAPPLLLAHVWDHETDLAGWWMSEKLDGVRAYWDGERFVSRLGNPYLAPEWFTAGFPREPLDGELWLDRKAFQRTVSVVRRQDRGDAWRDIKYLVFDAPGHGGSFEDRVAHYHARIAAAKSAYLHAHAHEPCRGVDHLRTELARVEALGGEGLMLRRPGSKYEVGRSMTLLKVKSFFDTEARVIGHQAGAGRHRGRLGALLVELPDGTTFAVGSGLSDAERAAPPPVGAIITFRYQELSDGGVPRFPTYVGVRHDVIWKAGAQAVARAAPKGKGSKKRAT